MPKKSSKPIEVGMLFGYWKVLELPMKGRVLCVCTGCNITKKDNLVGRLRNSGTKSCGCKRLELATEKFLENYGTTNPLKNKEVQQKIKETMKERYGVEYSGQSSDLCEKRKQTLLQKYGQETNLNTEEFKKLAKETCLEKYGTEHQAQSKEVRQKKDLTCIKRYGTINPQALPSIRNRREATSLEKYGVRNPLESREIRLKARVTSLEKYGVEHVSQLPENKNRLINWQEANPSKLYISKPELEILTFIQQYYPNARKMRKEGHELDIFIPEINLGIEHNGLYRHSELFKSDDYHLNKTKYFANLGIRVIHIWGHEWKDKKEQVKSFLLSAIGKNQHKIGARKCRIVWSNDKEEIRKAHRLLNFTHIQGSVSSTKYVTNVYYQDEHLATATFGKHHRNSKEWVLTRFTTKTNCTVPGILSRISKLASKELRSDIVSWADYRLSNGNGYEKVGWIKEELMRFDYFYFDKKNGKIVSKQSRQKKKIGTPEGMTEREHAKLDGLLRIYDCGKIRYKYGKRSRKS